MHRIDGPGATVDNRFTDGDPVGGVPATMVTDDWANAVQEEIVAVIRDPAVVPAITLNKDVNNQLVAAIKKLISAAAPDASPTVKGIARYGTPTEQLAGSLTAVMSNPAGVLALLTAWFPRRTFAYRDYIRIPDVPGGLIVQWGRDSNATAGPVTVSLATAFPSVKWLEISTPVLGSPSGWDVSQSAGSPSLSQSTFHRRSGNGTTTNNLSNFDIFWLALGF